MNSNQMCRQIKAGEKFVDFNKNNKKVSWLQVNF